MEQKDSEQTIKISEVWFHTIDLILITLLILVVINATMQGKFARTYMYVDNCPPFGTNTTIKDGYCINDTFGLYCPDGYMKTNSFPDEDIIEKRLDYYFGGNHIGTVQILE